MSDVCFGLSAVTAFMGGVPVQELQLPLRIPTGAATSACAADTTTAHLSGERERGVCATWQWAARRSLTAPLSCQRDALMRPADGAGVTLPVTARAVAEALPCLGCTAVPLEAVLEGAAMPTLLWGAPRWPAGTLRLEPSTSRGDAVLCWRDGASPIGGLVFELPRATAGRGGASACCSGGSDDSAAATRCYFRDPASDSAAVPTTDAGNSSGGASLPDSLLLPNFVCVRRSQPHATAALASGDGGDATPPSVEVVFIAVEGLPELQPVRRRGLRLYAKLLELHLGARQARQSDSLDSGEAESALGTEGTGENELPMPPPFAWRCELWTAAPAAAEAGPGPAIAGSAPGREVVLCGSYSPYACNKPNYHDRHAAMTASRSSSGVQEPSAAASVSADLTAWAAELSTFARWWRALTAVSQTAPAPPTPDAPRSDALPLASAELSRTTEELMHWWAATRASHTHAPPLPPLPSSATPLFGALVVPPQLRRTAHGESGGRDCDAAAAATTAVAVPAVTLCFVNPKGTLVHRYDHDAADVLCRAVHSLHAAVFVGDAAQKATLLAWLRHRVRHVDGAAAGAAGHQTGQTTEALQGGEGGTQLAYAFDAVAEVAQRCFCLGDYVHERHRMADHSADEAEVTPAEGPVAPCGRAADVQRRLSDTPTLAWCRAAQRLSYDDLFGRRRLDLATRPFQLRRPPASASRRAARAEVGTPAAPTLTLQGVPLSFLAFALTRLAEAGVEEVEPLTATVLQVGRRLSDH